jgi:hypothetical protein
MVSGVADPDCSDRYASSRSNCQTGVSMASSGFIPRSSLAIKPPRVTAQRGSHAQSVTLFVRPNAVTGRRITPVAPGFAGGFAMASSGLHFARSLRRIVETVTRQRESRLQSVGPLSSPQAVSGQESVRLQSVPEGRGSAVLDLAAQPARGDARVPAEETFASGAIVLLRARDPSDMRIYQTHTDAEGRYVFKHIPAGRYLLDASRVNGSNLRCEVSHSNPNCIPITLSDRGEFTQDVVLSN